MVNYQWINSKVVILCWVIALIGFLVGRWSIRRGYIDYKVGSHVVFVSPDAPSYGIPVVEYASALSSLRKGNTNEAISKLDTSLDTALDDAMHRRPYLNAQARWALDKSLLRAARYRQAYPRLSTIGTNASEAGVRPYWTGEREAAIDAFLEQIKKDAGLGAR